jgi:hypothetical protein
MTIRSESDLVVPGGGDATPEPMIVVNEIFGPT